MAFVIAAGGMFVPACSCGDDDASPDARPMFDAADPPDADETPDAEPPAEFAGQVSVLEVRVNGIPLLGSGAQVVASWSEIVDESVTKVYDDRTPVGEGCAAWVYDFAQGQFPSMPVDKGTMSVTGTSGVVPPCNFINGRYVCPAANGTAASGDSIVPEAGGANTAGIIIAGGGFTSDMVGMFVNISGVEDVRNTGAFPILNVPSTTTLIVGNRVAVGDADIDGATYTVVAGAGPIPTGFDFIADDDTVAVSLDAPAGDVVEDFAGNAAPAGDAFSLTPASQLAISTIPTDGTTSFSLTCDAQVAMKTGVGPAISPGVLTDEWLLTDAAAFGTVRPGAELVIAGATTAGNNGTFTITAADANTVTYVNANGAAEAFVAGSSYLVNDCGTASVSVVNMDFNNAPLIAVISNHTGAGASFVDGGAGDDCQISHTGSFLLGLDAIGARVLISDSTTAGNNSDAQGYLITAVDGDTITFTNAACASEDFAAGTTYRVVRDLEVFEMPSPTLATKAGGIFCASLSTTTLTPPAGALAALGSVDPTRVRTTYVRGGLDVQANTDTSNRTNISSGHGIVGFTTPTP